MASARPTLDREQTRKAVTALMKYIGKEKAEAKELFDDDEFLYVVRFPLRSCRPAAARALTLPCPAPAPSGAVRQWRCFGG